MESYFSKFRNEIIGRTKQISTPNHETIRLVYADWTASGRMYQPIENKFQEIFYPFVANTHTDTNTTGSMMTHAYHKAQEVIKKHTNASKDDILIACGAGMTGAINKFQRILGLKIHESFKNQINIDPNERPIVFVTHMEHHSNHTSWIETIAEVVVVPPNENGLVSVDNFRETISKYTSRPNKIAAITSCSNVTGIMTPYLEIAQLIHEFGGLCFVDFACSAPYVNIDMHVDDAKGRYLDAIYFSPHKFLGGPGSSGILIFNKKLYSNSIPDNPGGGTVTWTNPWGGHEYFEDAEIREDGGTPPFLQTIRAALCMNLKDEMGVENIQKREEELVALMWEKLATISNVHVLAKEHKHRLGIVSFYIDGLYHNLGVKILNDRFGIQTRGGCSCAGTYGHYLLGIDQVQSNKIVTEIKNRNLSNKPGWIRLSVHPTHTNSEVLYMMDAIKQLAENHKEWANEYHIDISNGDIKHKNSNTLQNLEKEINHCFELNK